MTLIHRAAAETETGIPSNSCWTEELETAEAYLDNPGFGGTHLRSIRVELDNVLDVTDGFSSLAEALGYDGPSETAAEWRLNGWLYPWEESGKILRQLRASGYEWLRYVDDYPEGAITLMKI